MQVKDGGDKQIGEVGDRGERHRGGKRVSHRSEITPDPLICIHWSQRVPTWNVSPFRPRYCLIAEFVFCWRFQYMQFFVPLLITCQTLPPSHLTSPLFKLPPPTPSDWRRVPTLPPIDVGWPAQFLHLLIFAKVFKLLEYVPSLCAAINLFLFLIS